MTEMNLSVKWKQTHRHREQTCGCQPVRRVGGVNGGLGSADAILCVGWINSRVLLQSTGSYTPNPVINHQGKERKKESYIYICSINIYIYIYIFNIYIQPYIYIYSIYIFNLYIQPRI